MWVPCTRHPLRLWARMFGWPRLPQAKSAVCLESNIAKIIHGTRGNRWTKHFSFIWYTRRKSTLYSWYLRSYQSMAGIGVLKSHLVIHKSLLVTYGQSLKVSYGSLLSAYGWSLEVSWYSKNQSWNSMLISQSTYFRRVISFSVCFNILNQFECFAMDRYIKLQCFCPSWTFVE